MSKLQSKKGKGGYERYRTGKNKECNKNRRVEKIEKRLAKRKTWRIKKFKGKTRKEISGTTDKLFYEWGMPVEGRSHTGK